jgi:hypothetical protein
MKSVVILASRIQFGDDRIDILFTIRHVIPASNADNPSAFSRSAARRMQFFS